MKKLIIKLVALVLIVFCIVTWTLREPGMAQSTGNQEQANIQLIKDYYAAYATGI